MFASALMIAAAALPSVLTLDDAVRIFRERGFDLLLANAQVASAQADEQMAGALPNPQLSFSAGHAFSYDATCPGCSPNAYTVGVTDPSVLSDLLTGKRGLRVDVARAALAAARRSREDALRTLLVQVKQAVLDASFQQAQRDFAQEVADSTEHTRALIEKRLQAGAISEAELARAEVAALEARQALRLANQSFLAARLQVAFLLGVREILPEFQVDPKLLDRPLPPPAEQPEQLVQQALKARPDLLALDQQVERAQTAISLARRQRVPDFSLSAQYQQQGTGNNAIQPGTLTVGVQLPVPVLYQQQGEIAKAEADLRSQTVQRDKAHAQVLLDVQAARAAVDANRELVERMRERILDRAKRARDLVQVQYEKGAASLLELLDAQRTWVQTHAEYLRDLHDFWLATFQFEAAMGST